MFAPAAERNRFMLTGALARNGYDWMWHNFTARHAGSGAEKAFFIEYFVCNPELGQDAPVFGGVRPDGGMDQPSYGLIKVGCWGADARQLHRYVPISEVKVGAPNRLALSLGDCLLSETQMRGTCVVTAAEVAAHSEWQSDSGALSWDLTIDKQIHYSVGYGASEPVRALNLFEMFWHAEGIKTAYSGWVELDGERYLVTPDSSFGYADKNWGSNFTSPWLWIGSSDLVSRKTGKRLGNSALEIGGGQPRVLGVPLAKQLLAYLAYEGEAYDFNFSKPWEGSSVSFRFHEEDERNVWSVTAESPKAVMEVDLSCRKDEMLLMRYQAPDGSRRHNRLWNGGTGMGEIRLFHRNGEAREAVDVIAIGHAGCEYGEYDATGPYRVG